MSGKVRPNQYLDAQTPKKPNTEQVVVIQHTGLAPHGCSQQGLVSRTFHSKILTACSLYCSCRALYYHQDISCHTLINLPLRNYSRLNSTHVEIVKLILVEAE